MLSHFEILRIKKNFNFSVKNAIEALLLRKVVCRFAFMISKKIIKKIIGRKYLEVIAHFFIKIYIEFCMRVEQGDIYE